MPCKSYDHLLPPTRIKTPPKIVFLENSNFWTQPFNLKCHESSGWILLIKFANSQLSSLVGDYLEKRRALFQMCSFYFGNIPELILGLNYWDLQWDRNHSNNLQKPRKCYQGNLKKDKVKSQVKWENVKNYPEHNWSIW